MDLTKEPNTGPEWAYAQDLVTTPREYSIEDCHALALGELGWMPDAIIAKCQYAHGDRSLIVERERQDIKILALERIDNKGQIKGFNGATVVAQRFGYVRATPQDFLESVEWMMGRRELEDPDDASLGWAA